MQPDIGESTCRTQMLIPPEPAVEGTRLPQLPTTCILPSTPPQPYNHLVSFNQLTGGEPLLCINLPVQAENKRRGRTKKASRDGGQRQRFTRVCWPTTLIPHLERHGIEKTEIKRNVEDGGKPVLVFSTNCEISFVFTLPCIIFSHGPDWHKLSSTCCRVSRKEKKKGRGIKRAKRLRWQSPPPPSCLLFPSNKILLWINTELNPGNEFEPLSVLPDPPVAQFVWHKSIRTYLMFHVPTSLGCRLISFSISDSSLI